MTKIQKSEESYIKNIFESISKDYDLMNDLITFKYHSKWKKEIVMIAKEDNPKVILDIATGTGDIAINLSKLKDSQIIGVDISEKMLDVAGDKIRKMNITNITLELSKAEKLKYRNTAPKIETEIKLITTFHGRPLKNIKPITVIIIKIVCPTSGCCNRRNTLKNNKVAGIIWRKIFSSILDLAKNQETTITNEGFKNSDGWIVKPKIGNHLDAPPLLIPITSVKKIPIKLIIKTNKDSFLVLSEGRIEIQIRKSNEIKQ